MIKGYRKVMCFKEFSTSNLEIIAMYFISGVIAFIGYKINVIKFDTNGFVEFIVSNFIDAMIVPFSFVYSLLKELTPIIITILSFKEYSKCYYTKDLLINIIPISNRKKFDNIISISAISFVSYIITTLIFALGTSENVSVFNSVKDLMFKIVCWSFILLNVIIVDIWCRKGKLNKDAKGVAYVIVVLISMFIFMNLTMIANKRVIVEVGTNLILVTLMVLQYIYILKNIDKIKIN